MSLIITLILAGIIGWIASIIMKVDGQMGWLANVIVGIVGGFLGTTLLGFIAPASPTDNGLSLSGIIVGIIGACIAIYIWKLISGRNNRTI
ncbi:MAG: GlsB/YeaQ/YmgE family stress response membrane protein [Candidatus Levyibacteriota bacterium]